MVTPTLRKIIASSACTRWLILCACALLTISAPHFAIAEPQLMTDSELDAVSARGTTNEQGTPVLDLGSILAKANPDGNGALFTFDLGNVFGSGGVDFGNLTGGPSTLTLNGDLYTQVLNVENLIFNLNICSGCDGTVYQTGLGVPININQPVLP